MNNIETIKLALEALESCGWNDGYAGKTQYFHDELVDKAIATLRQAIDQTQQAEPVAIVDSTITGHIDWLCTFFPKQGTKLYTSPRPRQWVGLTDWEINSIAQNNHPLDGIRTFARAIEAKLKEKNT